LQECFCKSKKARRHWISPATSSQLRTGKAGNLTSKINSNIKNTIILKRQNS
jgi:hypothetical protein